MRRAFWSGLAGLCLAVLGAPASAQTRLFSDDTPIAFTLTAPFGKLVRAARSGTDAFPATLALTAPSGAGAPIPLQLSPRGLTRRTGGYCLFPPLKLDFETAGVQGTVFQGQNKLKLVTHCKPAPAYEQLYIQEYLIYRLYNLLTPISFRVRPARVTYHDGDGQRDDVTRFGFLIEPIDAMARRNGLTALDPTATLVPSAQLDPRTMETMALFEFMIGNLDWDPASGPPGEPCCHNVKLLIRQGGAAGNIPVPYDFDFSGLVDAPYAVPPDNIRVPNVRVRAFRGYCRNNDQLPAAVATFREHRAAMAAVIAGEALLTPANRQGAQAYIDDFFAVLDDPQRLDREITRRCRG